MTFEIPGAAYDRFMGRYSVKLAPLFADFAGITPELNVLDVGCGPGALTAELVRRCGTAHVSAVEPSDSFVEVCRARFPALDVRHGPAERLPFAAAEFDAALAQLVLAFVSDADVVAHELKRVVRAGGTVAACMWHEGESLQMSDIFWRAAATLDEKLRHREANMPFRKAGAISELWKRAGFHDVQETRLELSALYHDFEDFWHPLLQSAGPIGAFMQTTDDNTRAQLRETCFNLLGRPQGSFSLDARACAARARV